VYPIGFSDAPLLFCIKAITMHCYTSADTSYWPCASYVLQAVMQVLSSMIKVIACHVPQRSRILLSILQAVQPGGGWPLKSLLKILVLDVAGPDAFDIWHGLLVQCASNKQVGTT
jgi:hypothetical protein